MSNQLLIPCWFQVDDHTKKKALFHGVFQEGDMPVAIVETAEGEFVSCALEYVTTYRQEDHYQNYLEWLKAEK